MNEKTVDVRKATCPGGGGLWAFLGHVRQIRPGGVLRLLTDDELAAGDIPAWTSRMGWALTVERIAGGLAFVASRPVA